jgi:hypothetical protein
LAPAARGDADGIADLDPDAARAGTVGAIDLLRNDALGTELARMGEYGSPIVGNVFVKQDASLGIAQQPRQRGLAIDEDFGDALDQGRSGAPGKALERLSMLGLSIRPMGGPPRGALAWPAWPARR